MNEAPIPRVAIEAVRVALALLPLPMTSDRALIALYAIGLQESRLIYRRQLGGPANGLWQFEKGGGVRGVFYHPASRFWLSKVCASRGVAFDIEAIYNALPNDDVLAAACARLLLFTDPKVLPAVGDVLGAWELYARTWRPGKPHPDTWAPLYQRAVAGVMEQVA